MDVNLLRSLITLFGFLAFMGVVWWAYGPKSKHRFDDAAMAPFADDEIDARSGSAHANRAHRKNSE